MKSGKYLRIAQNGSLMDVDGTGGKFCYFILHDGGKAIDGSKMYKLESNQFKGKYIAQEKNGNPHIGKGGHHCNFACFKQQGQQPQPAHQTPHPVVTPSQPVAQPKPVARPRVVSFPVVKPNKNNGKFDKVYQFKQNKMVVISGPHGKHLRVSPGDNSLVDGSGGQGNLAQWEVFLSNGNLIQLKNRTSGKFLRIFQNGNKIDCQGGKGGKFTFFKYHIHGKNNVVKLESNIFPNLYVAIPKNYLVKIGSGGPHCVLTFWKQ